MVLDTGRGAGSGFGKHNLLKKGRAKNTFKKSVAKWIRQPLKKVEPNGYALARVRVVILKYKIITTYFIILYIINKYKR